MAFTINQQEVSKYANLELLAKQVVEGFITGLHKSPFHGFSVEFAEHRLYNQGESTRHIDWKLYGRSDKLFIKRYEEETNLRCQLVIDTSSSMYYPEGEFNKIRFSVYAAAALCYLLKRQRDAVGLSLFSDKLEYQSKARSTIVNQKLLFSRLEKVLNDTELKKSTLLSEPIHQIAESIHKRSLVVLFSDMFDEPNQQEELFKALQHLRFCKHEVILFHVVDKQKEMDFEFQNRPYLFEDLETGEKLKLHPNEIKERYLEAVSEYKQKLVSKCAQYRIDFVEADINKGIDQVLSPFIVKRSKLY